MTYCVGIKLASGMVFASDSRTHSGIDQISTFRKMIVYERPGDRFMVLLSAGNLSRFSSANNHLIGEAAGACGNEGLRVLPYNKNLER